MSLYRQLVSILHHNSYDSITFYLNNTPIITLHLNHDNNTITLITNNMHEMNCHIYNYSSDVIVDIDNALTDDGIDELLLHNPNATITFSALFLSGVIDSHHVELEQLEIIDSNDNTSYTTYIFTNNSISLAISEIIMAFIYNYFT